MQCRRGRAIWFFASQGRVERLRLHGIARDPWFAKHRFDITLNESAPEFENVFLRHGQHVTFATVPEMFQNHASVAVSGDAPPGVIMDYGHITIEDAGFPELIVKQRETFKWRIILP
jgi:hypothetical protein